MIENIRKKNSIMLKTENIYTEERGFLPPDLAHLTASIILFYLSTFL